MTDRGGESTGKALARFGEKRGRGFGGDKRVGRPRTPDCLYALKRSRKTDGVLNSS